MARHKAGHTAHGVEEGGINCSSRTWGTSGEVGAGSTPKPPWLSPHKLIAYGWCWPSIRGASTPSSGA